MNIIYKDEPATYYALDALCSNESTRALGYDHKHLQKIAWWKSILRNWVKFSATDFPQPNLA